MDYLTGYLPQAVVIAIIMVICFVYLTIEIVSKIENVLEEKKGHQIKFFDHKKIWLSLFWCIVFSVVLVYADFITLKQSPFYCFVILGASTFLYEAVLKRLGKGDEN